MKIIDDYNIKIWSKTVDWLDNHPFILSWESVPEMDETIVWATSSKINVPDFLFGEPVVVILETQKNYRETRIKTIKLTLFPKFLTGLRIVCSELWLLLQ
jgi:hypothetical protein